MDFALDANQESIRDAIEKICARFDDAYWLKKDKEGGFPIDFHKAMADAGWLGICIPEEYGGSGLGITEAAIMMRAISESGAGMSGASAVHMNVFGLNPVVVFGTPEQCARMLPPIVDGTEKSCFAVTEPNTGLNTTQLKTRAVRKGDRYIVNGQKVWISTAQVADKILLLARTTPLEDVKSPTGSACSTRISTVPRSPCTRSRSSAARRSTPTSCSSPISKFRSRIASARRATASNISCTA
jgi:acyl-CoA dehydrogenase